MALLEVDGGGYVAIQQKAQEIEIERGEKKFVDFPVIYYNVFKAYRFKPMQRVSVDESLAWSMDKKAIAELEQQYRQRKELIEIEHDLMIFKKEEEFRKYL
jgi:hypothetical protein